MPIEDIDFLYKYGQRENKIIFIDSSKRNKQAYPHPSHYSIDFVEPFTNVYSVDILDAAIPRTMYNVDVHNNQLVVGIGPKPLESWSTIEVGGRDYNFDILVTQLSAKLAEIQVRYKISVTSNGDGTSKILLTSLFPFVLDMNVSSMAESIGFDEYAQDGTGFYTRIPHPTNPKLFGSVSKANTPVTTTFGQYMYGQPFTYMPGFIGHFLLGPDSWIAQRFRPTEYCYLRQLQVQFAVVGAFDVTAADLRYKIITHGIDSRPTGAVLKEGIFALDTATGLATAADLDADDFAMLHLDNLVDMWIVVYETTATSGANCLFIPRNTVNPGVTLPATNAVTSLNAGATWTVVSSPFCMSYTSVTKTFTITGPGVVSLIGERYVILRCPEVEQYIYGSVAYGNNSPGLALFKMGVVGYSDSRFDFSSITYKEFHPIGKLSRLTFAYERLNGQLYDFKGVNHHLLIVIRHFTIRQKEREGISSLNPSYRADYLQYLRTMEEREGDSDEEDAQRGGGDLDRRLQMLKKERDLALALEAEEEDYGEDDDSGEDDEAEDASESESSDTVAAAR